ncbi:uncharacterized protein METZ01_LOCUS281550 [marine metagenome]|uniref:Uncharacterized protein n=1 Tax=marine metagenome TaxID=408172 RepID=A0A382KWA1_9ZZZZ
MCTRYGQTLTCLAIGWIIAGMYFRLVTIDMLFSITSMAVALATVQCDQFESRQIL